MKKRNRSGAGRLYQVGSLVYDVKLLQVWHAFKGVEERIRSVGILGRPLSFNENSVIASRTRSGENDNHARVNVSDVNDEDDVVSTKISSPSDSISRAFSADASTGENTRETVRVISSALHL